MRLTNQDIAAMDESLWDESKYPVISIPVHTRQQQDRRQRNKLQKDNPQVLTSEESSILLDDSMQMYPTITIPVLIPSPRLKEAMHDCTPAADRSPCRPERLTENDDPTECHHGIPFSIVGQSQSDKKETSIMTRKASPTRQERRHSNENGRPTRKSAYRSPQHLCTEKKTEKVDSTEKYPVITVPIIIERERDREIGSRDWHVSPTRQETRFSNDNAKVKPNPESILWNDESERVGCNGRLQNTGKKSPAAGRRSPNSSSQKLRASLSPPRNLKVDTPDVVVASHVRQRYIARQHSFSPTRNTQRSLSPKYSRKASLSPQRASAQTKIPAGRSDAAINASSQTTSRGVSVKRTCRNSAESIQQSTTNNTQAMSSVQERCFGVDQSVNSEESRRARMCDSSFSFLSSRDVGQERREVRTMDAHDNLYIAGLTSKGNESMGSIDLNMAIPISGRAEDRNSFGQLDKIDNNNSSGNLHFDRQYPDPRKRRDAGNQNLNNNSFSNIYQERRKTLADFYRPQQRRRSMGTRAYPYDEAKVVESMRSIDTDGEARGGKYTHPTDDTCKGTDPEQTARQKQRRKGAVANRTHQRGKNNVSRPVPSNQDRLLTAKASFDPLSSHTGCKGSENANTIKKKRPGISLSGKNDNFSHINSDLRNAISCFNQVEEMRTARYRRQIENLNCYPTKVDVDVQPVGFHPPKDRRATRRPSMPSIGSVAQQQLFGPTSSREKVQRSTSFSRHHEAVQIRDLLEAQQKLASLFAAKK